MRTPPAGPWTIAPRGAPAAGRHWRLVPDGPRDAPWFAPAGDEPRVSLIEEPIPVPRPARPGTLPAQAEPLPAETGVAPVPAQADPHPVEADPPPAASQAQAG